jgi:hypothetical protein
MKQGKGNLDIYIDDNAPPFSFRIHPFTAE